MGASQTISEYSEDNLKTFSQNYTLVRQKNDKRFGEIKIYQNKTYKSFVFVSDKIFPSQLESDQFIKELKLRSNLSHKHLCMLLGYAKFYEKNICAEAHHIQLYGEWHKHSLKSEIKKRIPDNEFFTESEIWYIADALISVCAYLESRQIYHGDIRPVQVVLTEEGFTKLADHGLVNPYPSNYLKALSKDKKVFLSPELMECYKQGKMNADVNVAKSDMYSLGMTLLAVVALVDPSKTLYNYKTAEIDHDKIEKLLESIVKNGYSRFLMDLIRRMLLVKPEYRMTFKEAYSLLLPYQNQIRTMREFSMPVYPSTPLKSVFKEPGKIITNYVSPPKYITNSPPPIVSGEFYNREELKRNESPVKKEIDFDLYNTDDLDRRVQEAIKKTEETIKRNSNLMPLDFEEK